MELFFGCFLEGFHDVLGMVVDFLGEVEYEGFYVCDFCLSVDLGRRNGLEIWEQRVRNLEGLVLELSCVYFVLHFDLLEACVFIEVSGLP